VRALTINTPTGLGGRSELTIVAEEHLEIPRKLDVQGGLSGYETESLACCLAALDVLGSTVVLDIGANVGLFGLLMASVGGADVHMFEPVPWLAQTARVLGFVNEIPLSMSRSALSKEPGRASFYVSAKSDCSSSLRKGFRKAKAEIDVQVSTVDAYCEARGIVPGFLKIDTESTEPDVLAGAAETLKRSRPWILCEVLANRTEKALAEVMRPHGYTWFHVTDAAHFESRETIVGDQTHEYVNWLFVPGEPPSIFWSHLERRQQELRGCGVQRRLSPLDAEFIEWRNEGSDGVGSDWDVPSEAVTLTTDADWLQATVEGNSEDQFFLTLGGGERDLERPPKGTARINARSGDKLVFTFETNKEGQVPVRFWVSEYGEDGVVSRVQRTRIADGHSHVEFVVGRSAVCLRLTSGSQVEGKFGLVPSS